MFASIGFVLPKSHPIQCHYIPHEPLQESSHSILTSTCSEDDGEADATPSDGSGSRADATIGTMFQAAKLHVAASGLDAAAFSAPNGREKWRGSNKQLPDTRVA